MRPIVLAALLTLAPSVLLAPASATGCSTGPVNDCEASAIEWFAKPQNYSNFGATMEPGEPATCEGRAVHRSVWFTLEVLSPGASDPFMVEMTTDFWATLGVYERAPGGGLSLLSCTASWEDEGQHDPVDFLPCTAGKTYWIQVGGQSPDDHGTFELSESRFWKFDRTLSAPCPFKATLPTEPRGVTATGGAGQITLTWTEPWWDGGRLTDIVRYNVYRADTCAGPFTLLGSSGGRAYVNGGLAPAASYCYRVTAVNGVGEGPSEPGRSASSWPLPRPPVGLAVAPAGDGELRLTWSASPDAAGPARMLAHRIYRAEAPAGPFALVGAVGAEDTTWTDGGLGRGATAHYRVSAVSEVGESAAGDVASATTWAVPGVPRDVQARHRVGIAPVEFVVSWRAPADATPFSEYRVYRASSSTGAAQLAGTVSAGSTEFVDRWRGALLDYHYEVRAANPAGEGAPSARACAVFPWETFLARCE